MKDRVNIPAILRKAEEISPLLRDLFNELFSELEVVLVDDIGIVSASIDFKKTKKIYVERNFWEKYINDEEDAVTLFAHEILHQIAYTEDRSTFTINRLDNFSQDAWINSYLYKNFGLGKLFVRLYGDSLPGFLLRYYPSSEEVSKIESKYLKTNPGSSRLQLEQLFELWSEIYNPEESLSPSYIKLRLKKIFNIPPLYTDLPIRIICDTSSRKALREIFENSEHFFRATKRWGIGDKEEKIKIGTIRRARGTEQLIEEIRALFLPEGNQLHKMYDMTTVTGATPGISRKTLIDIARDTYPIFYENEETIMTGSYKNAALYLDLSGSMKEYFEKIYYLLRKLINFLSPPFYAFSNRIAPIGLADIMNLEGKTTYGTDFDIVIEDAKNKHIRNVIAITDTFWNIKEENTQWANRNLNILLIIPSEKGELEGKSLIVGIKKIKKLRARIILWEV